MSLATLLTRMHLLKIGGHAVDTNTGTTADGTLRVVVATDQPAFSTPIPVADGGDSLTVDGAVTVSQGTGSNLHTVVDAGTLTTITNVVHVDDNSTSLTVDGTVTVQQATASQLKIDLSATGQMSLHSLSMAPG